MELIGAAIAVVGAAVLVTGFLLDPPWRDYGWSDISRKRIQASTLLLLAGLVLIVIGFTVMS